MKRTGIMLVGALILLAGCFDIEMGMKLEKDLSGTVGMSMTIDMEPVVQVAASIQKGFSGEEGPPTEEELAAVRSEMMEDNPFAEEASEEEMRREMAEDLPEGFEVLETGFESDGLKTKFEFLVRFPHLNRLDELELNQPGEESGTGEMDFDSISNPFDGLQLIDEGDTWLLVSDAPNPVEDLGEQEEMMFNLDDMIDDLFGSLRIAITLEVAGEVVEHNATRVEGKKLFWEFTPETLKEAVGTDIDQIRVRFRK